MVPLPAGCPASKKRSTSSSTRWTWSWARSAARASISSAPIFCGATTGHATSDCKRSQAMNFDQAINIEDLHRIAKRKLPRIIFDYIEGGVEDERGLARNEAAFHK